MNPLDRADWLGQIEGHLAPREPRLLKAVLGKSLGGGSVSIPVVDTEEVRWILKAPVNPQGGRVVVTEYIVSQVGQLIGAPVCEVEPMVIPPDFEGISFPGSMTLTSGVGSASRTIDGATQLGTLEHRGRGDNHRRHVGAYALFDWCWGDDGQWLYCGAEDQALYSHDHGFYFPPAGSNWTVDQLEANVDVGHPLAMRSDGLDVHEITRVATALDNVTRTDLANILRSVRPEWNVPASDLEALGFFLERRAPQVAIRMRKLSEQVQAA